MDLYVGDCVEILSMFLPDNSVDSVVTDPPYGLSFMAKKWDYDVPSVDVWRECLRVLKPGGHLLAFAGTRTQHRMAVNIEDAGFEIRDMIAWVYGSGFPKSLDVSKAIDKAAGVAVGADGYVPNGRNNTHGKGWGGGQKTQQPEAKTEAAKQWQGWGTALKPALEPITVARKPFKGTVADSVQQYGTGAINVDGCRVGNGHDRTSGGDSGSKPGLYEDGFHNERQARPTGGRWPANLIHDGSEEVTDLLGSAARYFYCPKASKRDRDEGLDGFNEIEVRGGGGRVHDGYDDTTQNLKEAARKYGAVKSAKRNVHPTVKPTDLMRYLCRLVTPPGGIVLDPFMGSGSTGKAARLEGFDFIGIEREPEYVEIARARIEAV